jgi:hypothetical protein
MYVAIVRKGFVPNVRREVFEELKGLETGGLSFGKSTGEEVHTMGLNKRRNEKLPARPGRKPERAASGRLG